ncbi:hypothetical protein ACT6NV_04880 [Robiginitalea sp. IMCC44478]|uniref:hypothetical protein n=1 Tax=Robiginitalea sp. IMCC44478 TaxID=3459122 RepID=UPI004041B427
MENRKQDKSSWAIGGGLLIGLGAGFFFIQTAPLWFVGCMLIGLGVGLTASAVLSAVPKK